jgi:hypothetical protein
MSAVPLKRMLIAALCCLRNDRQEILAPSFAPSGTQQRSAYNTQSITRECHA